MTLTFVRVGVRSTNNTKASWTAPIVRITRINMDIVYTLSGNYTGQELRFSLRSLANIAHDKVFFVGGCPVWAKNVIHIPTEQKDTKYKNTTNNLIVVCKDSRISADFVLMNDDFFILDSISPEELNLHNGPVDKSLDRYRRLIPHGSKYVQGMEQTKRFLQEVGINNPLSYELHIPFVINKKRFLKMFSLPGISDIPCLHKRTAYGNLYLPGGVEMQDVKVFGNNGFVPDNCGKFLSCNDIGFWQVRSFLMGKFPDKSNYEI